MLNLRLRPGKDDGTIDSAKSKALKTLEITLGTALNSSADLSFKISRDDFVPEKFPFVVILEHSIDGGAYTQPATNSVFIVEKDSDDSKDAGKVATYEAIDFVTWLLQGALIHWHSSAKDGKRTWYEPGNKAASAGWILGGMLTENKNNQTFPALTWSFTNTKDSAGSNWIAGDKSIIAWELTKNLSEVLDQLTDDGMCEWSSTGVSLNLYRMGTMGNDYPDVVIGGRGFSAVPVSTDSTGMYSHIRAIPDGLPWQIYTSNTNLETRFGRRHIVLTQSGIKDVASSQKNAEPYVAAGKVLQRQEGYEWTPSDNTAHPFRDFNIGDQVTAHSRGGKLLRRVIGIVIRQSGQEPAQVTTMVGDFIKTRAAKLRDRLSSVSVGGAIGGSGSAFPSTPGPSPLAPIAPLGVLVTGNTGEWLSDGSARANVTVQWSPTTEATDGSEIDVVEYEVWSRTPSGFLTLDTATRDTQVQINSWVPGEQRLVAVRAKSARGIWSDYSTEFSVTPIIPDSIIPKAPVAVTEISNTGSWSVTGPLSTIKLGITPVTESTDGTPVTIKEYEIWVDGNPVMRTPTPSATLTQPAGAVRDYRARALSSLDVWGDLSPTISVTGNLPPVSSRTPTTPVLTTGAGNAFARWDGGYTGTGSGEYTVAVEARKGTGAWSVQGTLLGAAQQAISLGAPGDTLSVRLRAYDRLNRLTGTSAESSIVVEGIELPDISGELEEWIIDNGGSHVIASQTEPPIHKDGDLWFVLDGNGEVINIKISNGTNFDIYTLVADSIIVPNSVTSGTINMDQGFADKFWANEANFGKIKVDFLEPNFGDVLNLTSNVSIEPIRERQDTQDLEIAAAQEAADDAAVSASEALDAAGTAQEAVDTLAQGRVLSAEATIAALSGKIDTYENSFIFDAQGLHIRENKTAQAEMLLTSAGARLIVEGTEVSEWNQGQFRVNQIFVRDGGQIGNHIIDSSIPGHTTWRAL